MTDKYIIGSGGGGGGKSGGSSSQSTRTPVEAPNTLNSNVTAKFVDLISVGECEGLTSSSKSIYLNSTPLQNLDGSYNFEGVTWIERAGTADQSYIPGFTASATEVNVGVEVTKSTPVTRTINNSNIDKVSVKIRIPSLSIQNAENGDINGSDVRIQIKANSVTRIDDTISGKTTSPYERAYEIDLSGLSFPVNIQVVRITNDSDSALLKNQTFWTTYSEIIEAKFSYPHYAMVALSIDARLFGNNLPSRAYGFKGILLHIPSNYDPIARTYTGIWDGTFKVEWSNNPAWVLYELIINNRFGLGKYISASDIDKYVFYSIAQYCDELVDDGLGGQEPRFTCNGVIETRENAYNVLQMIASVFRGKIFYKSGLVNPIADKPSDPVKIYTNANVIGGVFNYQSTSASDAASVAIVTFNDPNDFYKQSQEIVEDHDLLLTIGEKKIEIAAPFCTSRGQAYRLGKWGLDTIKNQNTSINFAVGLEGADVFPGDVIAIADSTYQGISSGGRLVSASGSTLTLDREFTIESGITYTANLMSSDGTKYTRTINNSAGTYTELTLTETIPGGVGANSIFVIESSSLSPKQFKVTSVAEKESLVYEINAIEHDENKFARVEQDINLSPASTSLLNLDVLRSPANLQIINNVVVKDNAAVNVITLNWEALPTAVGYEYQYSINNGNFTDLKSTDFNEVEFEGPDGEYQFKVRSKNILGQLSPFTVKTVNIQKSNNAIPDVTNFTSVRTGNDVLFAWSPVDSELIKFYEIRRGNTWQSSYVVGTTTNNVITLSEPKSAKFLIKAKAYYNRYSDNAVSTTTIPSVTENVIITRDEKTLSWPGTRDNLIINDLNNLYFNPTVTLDELSELTLGDLGVITLENVWSSVESTEPLEGSYITPVIDLGGLINNRLVIESTVSSERNTTLELLSNSYPTLSDFPSTYVLGGDENSIKVKVLVSKSDDNVTYSDFYEYFPGFDTFRYIKIKLLFNRDDVDNIPLLTSLDISFDVPDKTEIHNDVSISSSGTVFNYTNSYTVTPNVIAYVQNGSEGDTVKSVKGLTSTTFTIYDKNQIAKSGLIDITVEGY